MAHRASIRQAGRTIDVPAGRTILDAALEAGIPYPHGCRSGRCGSCKSRLTGEVELLDHTRFALTQEDKNRGLILACRALPRGDVAVAWLEAEDEPVDHPVLRFTARVVSVEGATHDIKRIRLAGENAASLTFSAGQYARVRFPGAPARDYSMASSPDDLELEFHIRRVEGGAATTRIHDRVAVGDIAEVEGPSGSSYLREHHAGPILCIAGGSGLAPVKSIVETALSLGLKQPVHLYFGVRTERDLYLVEHFYRLAARHTNLSFTPVLSNARAQRIWRTGFVTDAAGQDLKDLDGWKTYVAGPPAMVDAAIAMTAARGLGAQDLHADVFFTPEEIVA
jgi:naphthalene 1,2-dioxygenase ferredoxin reductase component